MYGMPEEVWNQRYVCNVGERMYEDQIFQNLNKKYRSHLSEKVLKQNVQNQLLKLGKGLKIILIFFG